MNDIDMGDWLSIVSAPRDKPILIAWKSVSGSVMGYDVMKHMYNESWKSQINDIILPSYEYYIIGWMSLPELPKTI